MIATTSLSAQFFDRKWEGIEIARDSFGQNAVTDIGSGSNITLAGEWLGNSRDAGAIITQEMSFLDQHYLTLSYCRLIRMAKIFYGLVVWEEVAQEQ